MLDYFKKIKAQDSYFYQKIELSKGRMIRYPPSEK